MTITVVTVLDKTNPVEVQTWFNANVALTLYAIWNEDNTFFIVYS